MVDNVF